MFKWGNNNSKSITLALGTPLYPFDQLTAYFKDKYVSDGGDIHFVYKAEHFFSALQKILEGRPAPGLDTIPQHNIPSLKKRYEGAYKIAFNVGSKKIGDRAVTREQVVNYLVTTAQNVKSTNINTNDRRFYQHFFANSVLPLLFSPSLTDAEFNSIVENIPDYMLLIAQENSAHWAGNISSSQLFVQLHQSTCPTAIYRYSKIVSHFLANGPLVDKYRLSVSDLKLIEMQKSAPSQALFSIEIPVTTGNAENILRQTMLRTLLLSVRTVDQFATLAMLRTEITNSQLIADVLLDRSFLTVMGRLNPDLIKQVFDVIADAQPYDSSRIISNKLNKVFYKYAKDYDWTSIVDIATLSSTGCAAVFGMLNPVKAKKIYTKSDCDFILTDVTSADNAALVNVMSFIKHCMYPRKEVNLLERCGNFCMINDERLAINIAMGVNSYLTSQLSLYPEAYDATKLQLFESCINQLRFQFTILGEPISSTEELMIDEACTDENMELHDMRGRGTSSMINSSSFCQPVRPASCSTTSSSSPAPSNG